MFYKFFKGRPTNEVMTHVNLLKVVSLFLKFFRILKNYVYQPLNNFHRANLLR